MQQPPTQPSERAGPLPSANPAAPCAEGSPVSPAALWREWVTKSEQQWSEALSLLLKDERVSRALNQQVDEARMMQRMFAEMAHAGLAAANLPSRTDFEQLDERMGRLEDAVAGLSAALVHLRGAIERAGVPGAAPPRPTRGRRPAAKAAAPARAPAKPRTRG